MLNLSEFIAILYSWKQLFTIIEVFPLTATVIDTYVNVIFTRYFDVGTDSVVNDPEGKIAHILPELIKIKQFDILFLNNPDKFNAIKNTIDVQSQDVTRTLTSNVPSEESPELPTPESTPDKISKNVKTDITPEPAPEPAPEVGEEELEQEISNVIEDIEETAAPPEELTQESQEEQFAPSDLPELPPPEPPIPITPTPEAVEEPSPVPFFPSTKKKSTGRPKSQKEPGTESKKRGRPKKAQSNQPNPE